MLTRFKSKYKLRLSGERVRTGVRAFGDGRDSALKPIKMCGNHGFAYTLLATTSSDDAKGLDRQLG